MSRPDVEVADIFRQCGDDYRHRQQGHLSLQQHKVISAITRCRSATMGGHKLHCEHCHTDHIAYNSCRNRHCPKCQASAAKRWLENNQRKLLPIEYYHLVFTLPSELGLLAFYNKTALYHLLFQAASQTLHILAEDTKHLGAKMGMTMVLHTWGSTMTHHPHVHAIVTGGGIRDSEHWQPCKKGFLFPVKVMSRLFRRLYLEGVKQLFEQDKLQFYGELSAVNNAVEFIDWCQSLKNKEWVVYAKRPFADPDAVLAYLSRYTHRIAISNSRLLSVDDEKVVFNYKDYRNKGRTKHRTMALDNQEFIRRFLLHVLPTGFHRIRHYGLLNSPGKLKQARQLLEMPEPESEPGDKDEPNSVPSFYCRQCGQPMLVMAIIPLYCHVRGPP